MNPPPTLIESWLPFEAIGAESLRERGASSALPPLYFLHVWWARRPLTVSRAAILASLLPDFRSLQDFGSPEVRQRFPTREAYHAWFTRLLGILGDPVAARKLVEYEKSAGIRTPGNKYGYPRAFTHNPSEEDLETLYCLLEHTWKTRELVVLDPMAGGGSIPFEALRYGFTTYANELNPVASVILKATLDYPTRFGVGLADDMKKWGQRWYELAGPRLAPYFAPPPGEPKRTIYMWARTVACPTTGKPVPLSPNWWIRKGKDPVAVRLRTDPAWDQPRFEIVRGDAIDFDPDEGTVSRGVGRSPWTGETVDGDYIKREAQAGRMGQMLYCVETEAASGREYVAPTGFDAQTAERAKTALAENLPRWQAAGLVPTEVIPEGLKTGEPLRYGMYRWTDLFSPRQLLSLVTLLETLREVSVEMRQEMDEGRAAAVETYLAFAFEKAFDRNSRQCIWIPQRHVLSHSFVRHDYSFKWSFGEFNAAHNLLPWAVAQIDDAYRGLTELSLPAQPDLWQGMASQPPVDRLRIWQGNAADLSQVETGSVHHICVDPPYYDNVMYAELSDFYYVWLKRSVGQLYPDFFRDPLTNKDEEAVANPARFKPLTPAPTGSSGTGSPRGRGAGKARELAERDYQRKMAATFREMYRVVRDDGVLTVMFTHKRVEAWDTLATALIGAGFTIRASWPVATEYERGLHQNNRNAASSTILLACRKRPAQTSQVSETSEVSPVWWDDLRGEVRRVARERAEEFAAQGVTGVDLYISTFGPVLSVISQQWPVLTSQVDEATGEPLPLRPETALDLAREEVVALRRKGLLLGQEVEFDPVTDWYLMAWDTFKAAQFPADEARKLAIALGLDVERDLVQRKRVIAKKGRFVVLQEPKQRRRRGLADPEAVVFETQLDAAQAAMLIYQEDGANACQTFLKGIGLLTDSTFMACLQAMINAIPRTQVKGEFVRPEADALDRLRLAFFEDLQVPAEEEPEAVAEQMEMFGS